MNFVFKSKEKNPLVSQVFRRTTISLLLPIPQCYSCVPLWWVHSNLKIKVALFIWYRAACMCAFKQGHLHEKKKMSILIRSIFSIKFKFLCPKSINLGIDLVIK